MDFTEYALRRSQVPANDLSLSIHSPVLIYSFLAAYGLLTILMFMYVRAKFRSAAKTLNLLQAEWQSARSTHESFVGAAHEQLSKLTRQSLPPLCLSQTRLRISTYATRLSRWPSKESRRPRLPAPAVLLKAKSKLCWGLSGCNADRMPTGKNDWTKKTGD